MSIQEGCLMRGIQRCGYHVCVLGVIGSGKTTFAPPACHSEKRNVEMTRKTAKKRDYMIYYAIQYAIRAKTPEYSRFPGFSLCFASLVFALKIIFNFFLKKV